MKVIVFGASGFIGFPIAQALSRAGHIVYGVTRSETKGRQLAANEVFPIVGEPTHTQIWAKLIATADVVIEALGDPPDRSTLAVAMLDAVGATALATRPPGAPKLPYIFTSGTWVHGATRPSETTVSDTTPLVDPLPIVAWRAQFERTVLSDERVSGIVIRPALLYGGNASLLAPAFEAAAATERRAVWYGRPGGRLTLIHVDDLADAYVRAAEKAPILGGLAIDVCNDTTESVEGFLQRLTEVSGAEGPYKLLEPSNPYEEALAATILLRPYLARSLLGWQQKKPGLTDGLPLYYAAWEASRSN